MDVVASGSRSGVRLELRPAARPQEDPANVLPTWQVLLSELELEPGAFEQLATDLRRLGGSSPA